MNAFDDLKEQLPNRDRLLLALAIGVIGAAILGNVLLIATGILPRWQVLEATNTRLASAQDQLRRAHEGDVRQTSEGVQGEIDAVRQQIAEKSAAFMSEGQAAQALDHLYRYAGESGSTITNVQGAPVVDAPEEGPAFEVRVFRITARGSTTQLLGFLGRIEESALPSVLVTNVEIGPDGLAARLDMDVSIRVSSYAGDAADLATGEAVMQAALIQAWDIGHWTRVIDLLADLLEDDPGDLLLGMQLYTAYMNYGNELLQAGDLARAGAQFEAALELRPGSAQAAEGLQKARQQTALNPTAPLGLSDRLDAAWAEADWPQVIEVLNELRSRDPEGDRWPEKLYAAHVNHGYWLTAKGQYEEAKASFGKALQIRPNGGEAIAGLQTLAELPGPPSVPEP